MRYPAYSQYKESDEVQWLKNVPEHWDLKRSDGIILSDRNQVQPEAFHDEEVFHYSIPAVQQHGTGLIEDGETIASAKQAITEQCLLVSKLNPRKATICIAEPKEQRTLCSTEFVVLKTRKCSLQFLYYFTQSELFRQGLDSKVQSVTRSHQRAAPEDIYKFWAAWPTSDEQSTIADFLDRETGRIDTLVAKKRRLIALLKEKRTALISRTVTRGLSDDAAREFGLEPHTRFKDSGIEWLGEVPEEWGRPRRLTRFAKDEKSSFVNGPFGSDLLKSEIIGEGVPVIYIRDISSGKYLRKSEGHVTAEKAEQLAFCSVQSGDILVAKVGDPPGTAVVYPDGEPEAIVTQDVIRIRVDRDKVNPNYLAYFLNSSAGQGLIDQVAIESTRKRVGLGDYKCSLAIFPVLVEQTAIATYLDRETSKLDKLMDKVETAIERVNEYRTALITDAVTGKIDVREAAA